MKKLHDFQLKHILVIFIFGFVFLFWRCTVPTTAADDTLEEEQFDVIEKRPEYLKEKERRLQEKYDEVASAKNDSMLFDALAHGMPNTITSVTLKTRTR